MDNKRYYDDLDIDILSTQMEAWIRQEGLDSTIGKVILLRNFFIETGLSNDNARYVLVAEISDEIPKDRILEILSGFHEGAGHILPWLIPAYTTPPGQKIHDDWLWYSLVSPLTPDTWSAFGEGHTEITLHGDAATATTKTIARDDDNPLVTYDDEKVKDVSVKMLDEQFEIKFKSNRPVYAQISDYFSSNSHKTRALAMRLLEQGFTRVEDDATRKQIARINEKFRTMLIKKLRWNLSKHFQCVKRDDKSNFYHISFKSDASLLSDLPQSELPQSKEEFRHELSAVLKRRDEDRLSILANYGLERKYIDKAQVDALYRAMSDATEIYKDTSDYSVDYSELMTKDSV